jgi:two-component system phosphate regulon response regulator PhoB
MRTPAAVKQKVLVIEDESDLSSSLAFALRAHGYDVMIADRGAAALQALDSFQPDLILLDLMLPDMSGLEICRKVREAPGGPRPAVIILSARVQEIDRVVGFEVGADDYVTKPFSVRELMLRIEARLRMQSSAGDVPIEGAAAAGQKSTGTFTLRNLRVDETTHRAFVDDEEIHLSALELRLLMYLFRAPGHMRNRRELLTEVWGYHPEVASRTVDTHIKRLRDKLGAASDLVKTVRGVGFRLAGPDEQGTPSDAPDRRPTAPSGSLPSQSSMGKSS